MATLNTTTQRHLAPGSATADFGSMPNHLTDSSPLSQSAAQQTNGRFNEEWDASQRGSSVVDGQIHRSNSAMSQPDGIPSRGGTLKKKASLRRGPSLKRSSSRRSSRAGSVRSLAVQSAGDMDEMQSAFFSPVPTTGNPTEILANRFQAWRKLLKDLITYFREIQASYDHRAKTLLKVSNVINNTGPPTVFLQSGGVDDALQVLRAYHKSSIAEANKSKDIENDVILALVGLRSDLNQKIKEIKSLSGDFKNSVDKEMDSTRRAVHELQEGLGQSDLDPAQMTGKKDPYLLKLNADRQVERQIDEENYLHQAYLNLEASGRELEAIVVGEIQKSYNAYAGILKREADSAYSTVEDLRTGPIAMPKDHEWNAFIENDEHFVDPRIPVRQPQNIFYPGRDNELAQEVRAGLLERKSKYLKSYTAGWYVLSPTHLHEFKSADKAQAPIMSLYLPEQKLGSHSNEGSSSNKFMLKGRQTGSMHRGHSWVFRCESHETMLAWYEDIRILTEKSPQERNAFVRQHARSVSGTSQRAASISSDGIMDEEDEEPFSAANSAVVAQGGSKQDLPRRPQPGGRFPSDLEVSSSRGLQAPLSPSSGSSGEFQDRDIIAAAGSLPGSGVGSTRPNPQSHAAMIDQQAHEDGINPYTYERFDHQPEHNVSTKDSEGMIPVGGAAVVGAGIEAYHHHEEGKAAAAEADEYRQRQQKQAAIEATKITSPDTYAHDSALQASKEATTIAAPDTYAIESAQLAAQESLLVAAPDMLTPTTNSQYMSGGRSQGDVSRVSTVTTEMTDSPPTSTLPNSNDNPFEKVFQPLTGMGRPTLSTGQDHSSYATADLHIPGEFPRGIANETKSSV